MEKNTTKKRGFAAIFRICPVRHVLALLGALVIGAHLATRGDHALNRALSEKLVRPIHRLFSQIADKLPFSLAELLIGLASVGLLVYITAEIVQGVRRKGWGRRAYRIGMTLLSAFLAIYAGFCLLWGVFYYGDDFMAKSGLSREKISAEELQVVTAYFADLANAYAPRVPRDENGVCAIDRAAVLARSPEVYASLEQAFPCLQGPPVRAKGIFFSRVMSYTDFTGFFFPFTAEANVNTDFPSGLFPSTVAHELAHQRGVAKEQEANFVAVLACLDYGDPEYVYSAALLAYIHLGNALYSADRQAWETIAQGLSDDVRRDFAAERAYWKQFETPVQEVSNTVYENFLYSYDQDLGLKSYGACVDLLVNYYYETALAARTR
ncbi:MAG: DUF3810 domain-containing protein [Oscillospiraceae bacterium]|nr:DUF3810 domain-containing protein [Oscillospiraceae bacterium]